MQNPTTAVPPMRVAPAHRVKQLKRWQTLLDDLAEPNVELLVENIAPVVATFTALQRAGHQFDFALTVIMGKLRHQLTDQTLIDCIEDHETQHLGRIAHNIREVNAARFVRGGAL